MPEEPPTPAQLRIKAGTIVVTTLSLGALLLHDWGPNNVFSGVRPAVKRFFNQVYGVQPKPQQQQPASPPAQEKPRPL